jgi:ABC-type multidrug transport system fused ATPase/permease subunit
MFQFYPPFNFAKVYSDIAALSSNTIDLAEGKIVEGPGFFWADLYKVRTIPKFFTFPDIEVPPPINSIYYLLMNFALFTFLTWYLDNVLPGEHGSPRPFYFFLTREYWGFARRKSGKRLKEEVKSLLKNDELDFDSDVEKEKVIVEEMQDRHKAAILIDGLVKSYKYFLSFFFTIFRKGLIFSQTMTAVDNIHFRVEENETLCLLGHNGAGKTTTINMLT